MKGGANPFPSAVLFFPESQEVPIYCWLDGEIFPSSDGKAQVQFHDLPATLVP